MLITHRNKAPQIHPSAWIAPNATLVGDVTIGPDSRVMYGAVLNAEGGSIEIGRETVVMENAVVRASKRASTKIDDHVLIGPHAHCTGCTIENAAFIATGASIFNGAIVGERATVRINAIVHINAKLDPDATVPISWIAVGDPARAFPPSAHEEFWPVQREANFPMTVWGMERAPEGETIMPEAMARYAKSLAAHREDEVAG